MDEGNKQLLVRIVLSLHTYAYICKGSRDDAMFRLVRCLHSNMYI